MVEPLISPEDVVAASVAVQKAGQAVVTALAELEPHLSAFVAGEITRVAGELSLRGAPSVVTQKVANEMGMLMAIIADAYQRGNYRHWIGLAAEDSPLVREGLVKKAKKQRKVP